MHADFTEGLVVMTGWWSWQSFCSKSSPPHGVMRSALHCNRFQMVLETEADSEHQKKSVNLELRTKILSCPNEWHFKGEALGFSHFTATCCWPAEYVHLPPQEHWFQMVLERWQHSKPPSETSFQGGQLRKIHLWCLNISKQKICKSALEKQWAVK